MIFVVARHDVYVRLHKRILEVIDTVVPVSKVRSIDEVVCNLLAHEAREGAALSQRMKSALVEAFSDTLACSIGMAPTELLAKIGAELNRPDGFVLIEADDLPARLEHIDLDVLPGISKGMRARLTAAHVNDFKSLWQLAPKQAWAIWGSVEGSGSGMDCTAIILSGQKQRRACLAIAGCCRTTGAHPIKFAPAPGF